MHNFDDLKLEVQPIGEDFMFVIAGGVKHIGAASTAYHTNGKIRVETCSVPGHKEYTLSEELAIRAATKLGHTVTLIMGIHYDNLTHEEIEAIALRCSELVDGYLAAAMS